MRLTHRLRQMRVLELGSGLGKCGLLAHLWITSQNIGGTSFTVLTDGETNVLHAGTASSILFGCDLIYNNKRNVLGLFETVNKLLDNDRRELILAHNEEHSVPIGEGHVGCI